MLVSHFDISGKEDKLLQSENIFSIFVTLEVFHFDISGKDFNNDGLFSLLNNSINLFLPSSLFGKSPKSFVKIKFKLSLSLLLKSAFISKKKSLNAFRK